MLRALTTFVLGSLASQIGLASAPIAIHITAYPDGLSHLTLRANTARWQNLVYAAPGRHQAYYPGFQPTTINGTNWFPSWPDAPDPRPGAFDYENRDCLCFSDTFHGVFPYVPGQTMNVTLVKNTLPPGGDANIVELPTAGNGFAVIIAFDDRFPGGPNLHDVTLLIEPVPLIQVSINVRPGSKRNNVNTGSKGVLQVAILSSALFDATLIDRNSLSFGRTGDERSLDFCLPSNQDVDGDRRPDLVCHFQTELTGLDAGDIAAVLKGLTADGTFFMGSDGIRLVP